jgi:hypothetical protein
MGRIRREERREVTETRLLCGSNGKETFIKNKVGIAGLGRAYLEFQHSGGLR